MKVKSSFVFLSLVQSQENNVKVTVLSSRDPEKPFQDYLDIDENKVLEKQKIKRQNLLKFQNKFRENLLTGKLKGASTFFAKPANDLTNVKSPDGSAEGSGSNAEVQMDISSSNTGKVPLFESYYQNYYHDYIYSMQELENTPNFENLPTNPKYFKPGVVLEPSSKNG